jgi:hypothetical protein
MWFNAHWKPIAGAFDNGSLSDRDPERFFASVSKLLEGKLTNNYKLY